jgi:hypothetical protein
MRIDAEGVGRAERVGLADGMGAAVRWDCVEEEVATALPLLLPAGPPLRSR